MKERITIRIDQDVLEKLKAESPGGYQTRINEVLRDYVERKPKKGFIPTSEILKLLKKY